MSNSKQFGKEFILTKSYFAQTSAQTTLRGGLGNYTVKIGICKIAVAKTSYYDLLGGTTSEK